MTPAAQNRWAKYLAADLRAAIAAHRAANEPNNKKLQQRAETCRRIANLCYYNWKNEWIKQAA